MSGPSSYLRLQPRALHVAAQAYDATTVAGTIMVERQPFEWSVHKLTDTEKGVRYCRVIGLLARNAMRLAAIERRRLFHVVEA